MGVMTATTNQQKQGKSCNIDNGQGQRLQSTIDDICPIPIKGIIFKMFNRDNERHFWDRQCKESCSFVRN